MDEQKPVAGRKWRGYLKEYAIIVVGVLTALVAQELVVMLHHHSEVANLRRALHTELAWNLGTLKEAADDLPCVEQRVKEFEDWKASLQSGGQSLSNINVPRPRYRVFRTSTWRSTAGATLDNLPLDERIAYAQFYDGVSNNATIRDGVVIAWRDLDDFEGARSLSAAEARQVTHGIEEIREGYRRMASNYNNVWKAVYAPAVHLTDDDVSPDDGAQRQARNAARATLCQPITAK